MSFAFRVRICVGVLPLMLLSAGSALAQTGDVSKGEELAKTHCASCHELTASKGQERDGRYVPSLAEVANTPHYTLVRLRRIIAVPPHSVMPKAPLDTAEINDIAYYITSLQEKKN